MNSEKKILKVDPHKSLPLPLEVQTSKIILGSSQAFKPPILTYSSKKHIAFGLNEFVYVYEDGTNIVFKESIGEQVTTVCITEDADFLVATGISGSVLIYSITSKKLVWKKVLCKSMLQDSVKFNLCFLDEFSENFKIFLYKENALFIIKTSALCDFCEAAQNGRILELMNAIQVEEVDLKIVHPNSTFKPFSQSPGDNFYCAVETSPASHFSFQAESVSTTRDTFDESSLDESRFGPNFTHTDSFFCVSPCDETVIEECPVPDSNLCQSLPVFVKLQDLQTIKKLAMTSDKKYIFQLTNTATLILMEVQADTNVVLKTWSLSKDQEIIEDFIVKEINNFEPGGCTYRIGLIVSSMLHSEQKKFEIRDINFQKLHSVDLPACAEIVPIKHNQDHWYVMVPDKNSGNMLRSLDLTSLFEVLPQEKLVSLLKKKKYDEALKLAADFKMDVEVIYQAKVRDTLDLFSSEDCSMIENADSHFVELEKDLKYITSSSFLCKCFELSYQEKYLKSVLECLKKSLMRVQSSATVELSQKINDKLYNIETLEKLQQPLDTK